MECLSDKRFPEKLQCTFPRYSLFGESSHASEKGRSELKPKARAIRMWGSTRSSRRIEV